MRERFGFLRSSQHGAYIFCIFGHAFCIKQEKELSLDGSVFGLIGRHIFHTPVCSRTVLLKRGFCGIRCSWEESLRIHF